MAASSDSDSDWEDVEDAEGVRCPCLFCSRELDTASDVLDHCAKEHGVDILDIRAKRSLDFYSCVKLINYIRTKHPSPLELLALAEPPYPWEEEEYFRPVLEADPLLQFDFEGSDTTGEEVTAAATETGEEVTAATTETDKGSLLQRLHESERKAEEYKSALAQALTDLESMRLAVTRLFSDDTTGTSSGNGKHSNACYHGNKMVEEEEEDGYFSTYSHFSIHDDMLKDEVRTESYRCFIERNPLIFKDKVVLDIGCGTGILSMFAAKAGARRVIGVDQSNIIYRAMDIIRENGFTEQEITLVKGRVEDVEMPVEKVDVIISEWMGYFLLFESMLDTVLFARDKWLKDPTQVYPNSCSLSLVAMGDTYEWQSRVQFWDDVYGFKMSCMKQEVFREALVHDVDSYSTISSSDVIKKFDLSKVKPLDLQFEAPFVLTMQQDTLCHALVGYFDVGFVVEHYPVHFSTSPQDIPTHWKQTVFYLREPIQVHTGDILQGTVSCRKNKNDPRALDIVIRLEHSSFLSDAEPIKIEQKFSLL